MDAYLSDLRDWIPRSLVDGAGWERLLARVGSLPGRSIISKCGFEFRLTHPAPATDFFVPITPRSYFVEHLSESAKTTAARALARHAEQLGDAQSRLVRCSNLTMIEYDIAETAEHDNPEPGVFLKLRTNANSERDRMSTELLPHALEELARAVGWSDWRAERDAVGKALAALASSGEILHVGARPNLQPRAVRLVARRIDADALPTVLNRLHWPGAVSEVTRSLGQLEGVFNEFMLSIDVTAAGLLPRLGMELSQTLPAKELEHTTARHLSELSRRAMSKGSKHKVDNAGLGPWLTTGRGDWQPLISRLRDLGWCLPEKAQGLLAWPKLATINRNGKAFLLYRGINHIKLLIGADHTINAKAYAGMSFAELTP